VFVRVVVVVRFSRPPVRGVAVCACRAAGLRSGPLDC